MNQYRIRVLSGLLFALIVGLILWHYLVAFPVIQSRSWAISIYVVGVLATLYVVACIFPETESTHS